jgi:hypothetical protein
MVSPTKKQFQVSGTGCQVQVRVRGIIQILNLYPNLNTRTWLPTAETRDLKCVLPSSSSGLRFPFELSPLSLANPSTNQL